MKEGQAVSTGAGVAVRIGDQRAAFNQHPINGCAISAE